MTHRWTIAISGLLVASVLIGCDRNREKDERAEAVSEKEQESEQKKKVEREEQDESGSAKAETASPGEGAEAINTFGHAMLGRAGEGNVAFSPTSISTVMGMLYAGAGGDTAKQIADAFAFTEGVVPSLGALTSALKTRNKEITEEEEVRFNLVNDIWLQKGFQVQKGYLDEIDRYFQATPRQLEFKKSPEDARSKINDYISKQTHKKIPELVPQSAIRRDTRTVLTNAVYMKASWATPFPEDATKEETFHAPDGDVETPTMHLEEHNRTATGEGFRALELPYIGADLAALVILPDKGKMADVQERMTAEAFTETIDSLERKYIDVALPKFEVREKFDLAKRLKAMGVKAAFAGDADFDDIHPDLFLDAVVHEAYVKIDEKGTEAAAATAASMRITGMPPEPAEFHVDRPFLFYIYDRSTKTMLFVTRITDPTK